MSTLEKMASPSKKDFIQALLKEREENAKKWIEESFQQAALKYDVIILCNPINRASLCWMLAPEAQSKKFSLRSKTSREGFLAGLIRSSIDNELIFLPASFRFAEQIFTAVRREGEDCWVEEVLPDDTPYQIACSPSGSPITSDVDVVAICKKKPLDEEILFDEQFGELTPFNKRVIECVNTAFQSNTPGSNFKLVSHGPASSFQGSKYSHLHFPMKVFWPGRPAFEFGVEGFSTIEELKEKIENEGYCFPWNEKWSKKC